MAPGGDVRQTLAEVAGGRYLRKKVLRCIEGQLRTRKWTDPGGGERYTVTEINVPQIGGVMQMLGGGRRGRRRAGRRAAAGG